MEKENTLSSSASKMNILDLLKNILPFVLPYRWLIGITLVLTLVGSLMAQVNAVVLDRAVDTINALIQQTHFSWGSAVHTVIIISHNIGQIIDADQIYVLQEGRVMQSGTPGEVYRQGGVYKEIFDASARSMNADKIAETMDGEKSKG